MQAPPNRKMHDPLCQPQKRLSSRTLTQLWIPAPSSMCLPVLSAALVPAGFSIVRQHAGCTARSPPPLPPNHAAPWCLRRPVFHKSRRPTVARLYRDRVRFLRFPSNCSHSWFRRTFIVTFCMRASHADVYPELLQDSRGTKRPHPRWSAACRVPLRTFWVHPFVENNDSGTPRCA